MKMSFGKLLLCVVLIAIGIGIGVFYSKFGGVGQALTAVSSGHTTTAYIKVNTPPGLSGSAASEAVSKLQSDSLVFIRSEKVLFRALKEQVERTTWFVETKAANKHCIPELNKILKVQAVPNSNLISITVTGSDRKDITDIANAVAYSAVCVSKEDKRDDIKEQLRIVEGEIESLNRSVGEYSKRIEISAKRGLIGEGAPAKQVLDAQVGALAKAQVPATFDYVTSFKKLDMLKKSKPAELADLPEFAKLLLANADYVTLEKSLADLNRQLAAAKSKDSNQQLTKKRDEITKKLAAKRDEILKPAIEKETARQVLVFNEKESRLEYFRHKIAECCRMLREYDWFTRKIEAWEAEIRAMRKIRSDLLKKRVELRMQMRSDHPLELFIRANIPYID